MEYHSSNKLTIENFRIGVLRLYNKITLAVSIPLVILYGYMGLVSLSFAVAIFFICNIVIYFWIKNENSNKKHAANIFILITILLIATGHYFGDEILDNKPWAILIPIISLSLVRISEGVIWSGFSILLLVIVYLVTPSHYESTAILIQLACFLTTAYVVMRFIHQNENNLRLIYDFSRIDPLTQTYNRLHFNETFENEIRRSRRNNSKFAVLMADIDHFKEYNDFYGHLKGDDVIETVAKTLRETTRRAGDLLYRYGGEEFCILLTNIDRKSSLKLTNQLCDEIRNLGIKHERSKEEVVTVSIGFVHSDDHKDKQAYELLDFADNALYRAKQLGRDQVVEAGT